MINYVIIAIACLAAGFFVGYLMLGTFNKKARREMEAEAELLKKNKEIEVLHEQNMNLLQINLKQTILYS